MKGWSGQNCETPIACGYYTCGVLGRCITGGPNGFYCECPRTYSPESRCQQSNKNMSFFIEETQL